MGARIVMVGTGALGGYIGGHLVRAGEDITLVDMWGEHVEAMRRQGLHLSQTSSKDAFTVKPNVLDLSEVQTLAKQKPIDIAFLAVKSYDTTWATQLIYPYLADNGCVVSLQNCINEERISEVVGWGKTLGSVISHLGVELYEPGRVKRTVQAGGASHTVFRVGEVHGRIAPRTQEVARLLGIIDSVKVTTNLWGERWSKLVLNASVNGLAAATGLGGSQDGYTDAVRWVRIRLASEAVRVGQALGYELVEMQRMQPDTIARAGEGDKEALAEFMATMAEDSAASERPRIGHLRRKISSKGAGPRSNTSTVTWRPRERKSESRLLRTQS